MQNQFFGPLSPDSTFLWSVGEVIVYKDHTLLRNHYNSNDFATIAVDYHYMCHSKHDTHFILPEITGSVGGEIQQSVGVTTSGCVLDGCYSLWIALITCPASSLALSSCCSCARLLRQKSTSCHPARPDLDLPDIVFPNWCNSAKETTLPIYSQAPPGRFNFSMDDMIVAFIVANQVAAYIKVCVTAWGSPMIQQNVCALPACYRFHEYPLHLQYSLPYSSSRCLTMRCCS